MRNRQKSVALPKSIALEKALEQAPLFLSILGLDGRIVWCNRYAWGYDESNTTGRPSDECIHSDDRPLWEHARRICLDLGEVAYGRVRLDAPGEAMSPTVQFRMCPVREDGRIVCLMAACWDVTSEVEVAATADTVSVDRYVLSPVCRAVVPDLLDGSHRKGSAIGAHIGEVTADGHASQKLRVMLANMVERGILRHGPGGYYLAEEFRPLAERLVRTKDTPEGFCRPPTH